MKLNSTPVRYLIVTLLGLAIDIGLALLLVHAGFSRPAAAAAGVVCGAASNFMLHRIWTFPSDKARSVGAQLLTYVVALALTLAIRIAVLAIIGFAFPVVGDALALFIAVGVSFICNFLLLKRLVFIQRISP